MSAHEFITVLRRRWCVGCRLYQSLAPGKEWRDPAGDCPRNTPYAVDKDAKLSLKLVRVVAPHFVAGFETDGIVRSAAPILKKPLLGKTDEEARAYIKSKGWKASVVSPGAI